MSSTELADYVLPGDTVEILTIRSASFFKLGERYIVTKVEFIDEKNNYEITVSIPDEAKFMLRLEGRIYPGEFFIYHRKFNVKKHINSTIKRGDTVEGLYKKNLEYYEKK